MRPLIQIFTRLFDYFLFGNWLISMAGILLTMSSVRSLSLEIRIQIPVLILVGAGVMFIYSVHAISQNNPLFSSVRKNWINNNQKLLVINFVLAAILIAGTLPFLNRNLFLLIVPCGLVSLAYSFRIRINKKVWALREVPFIKALVVSAVWSLVSVLLPLLQANTNIYEAYAYKAGMLIGIRFLILLILCLLFDIRDIKADSDKGIKTFSSITGIKGLKAVCFIFLLILSLFSAIVSETALIHLFAFDAAASAFIIFTGENQNDYFYSFAGDGLIILYSFAVLFSN